MLKILLFAAFAIGSLTRTQELDSWYRGYNETYFQNQLPAAVITRDLRDDRLMAYTEQANGYFHIAFNPKYNVSTKQERLTLLHEQCHIWVSVNEENEFDDHGPNWQHCMHSLSDRGAMEPLW